jgi:hypothetical protein
MTLLAQFAATGGGVANYIEDVFSTYLYTGTGAAQTITNGVDLSGKGGLVWTKSRSASSHRLFDTVRGATKVLYTEDTSAQSTEAQSITSFGSTGFTLGTSSPNASGDNYVSWTFRKQPKFFDVVTYTGDGTGYRSFATALGSAAGCIIIKDTSNVGNWFVYHRSLGDNNYLFLNTTDAASGVGFVRNVTTSSFETSLNTSGRTYVAYLFAHNAGGFGLTGTDNVISCGSFTTDGSANATVNLGYEPQWVMWKSSTASDQWQISDTMRGWSNRSGGRNWLRANATDAETVGGDGFPTSTGFEARGLSGSQTYIYIAIRRGPMKVPTTGTSVFSPNATTAASGTKITTNFPVDVQFYADRAGAVYNTLASTRLMGVATGDLTSGQNGPYLVTSSTAAEATFYQSTRAWDNTGFGVTGSFGGASNIYWNWQRAPGYFDVVCWTGAGQSTVQHGLTVVPEIVITKARSFSDNWDVDAIQSGSSNYQRLRLNTTGAKLFNVAAPTSTVFTPPSSVNGATYVTYLFATCPGVSKVGGYTGTGTTLQINCGFTAGSRFVLIKRTDSTGDWYVWDSARGIVAGNDPYILPNSTAAEVTSTDYVDTFAAGFELTATAPAAINANGGSFIFLAIA